MFGDPNLPLIDGRGAIWHPRSSDSTALRDYTLGHQVVEPYDFTAAIRVAAREFMPDVFIVLGPGGTLGGAVAQSLLLNNWRGLGTKSDFKAAQDSRARAFVHGAGGAAGVGDRLTLPYSPDLVQDWPHAPPIF